MGSRKNYQRSQPSKGESPLHILPVADKMIHFTLTITDNATRFPKKIRFSVTNKIQGHALAIYDNLVEANEIFPIMDDQDKADRLKSFMSAYYRKNGVEGWVLKCDVRKYFYRINHDVLKSQLRRLIKDRDVLWLLDMIVDSTEGPGIPIGNHTSQWFAILYLSDMDHMIKERLGIKYYGRYMDDFYLIHEDRAYLQFCLEEIRRFLVPMGLELNQKTAIFPLSQGIDFLGFRTYLTDSGKVVRKVRRESKNRIRRKIKKFRHLVDEGRVDFDTVLQSYNSWTGHADHGNSYHLISEIDDLFFNLFREEMEGKPYGEISIRFARWKRRQVGEHKVQRTGDPVDRRHTGHVPGPNGPGDGTHDHTEMLRREGAEQRQQ